MGDVKHTVYLPADFVRALQERALAERRSSYGAVQAFLRSAVRAAIAAWQRGEKPAADLAAVAVPAPELAFYQQLVRYLESRGAPAEEEWKAALRRAVAAWARSSKG